MNKANITIHPLPSQDRPIEKETGQLSVDIFKTEKEIVILAPVAGVIKEDIHLSITDDVLVIKGSRLPLHDVPEENYYNKECFWGNFSRAIVLPLEADSKHINASFENSVLEIRIPRVEKERTQIIKIKS